MIAEARKLIKLYKLILKPNNRSKYSLKDILLFSAEPVFSLRNPKFLCSYSKFLANSTEYERQIQFAFQSAFQLIPLELKLEIGKILRGEK